MPRLPQISGKELGRVLTRLGFRFQSQRGSHMKFSRLRDSGKEIIIIPNHRVIRKGTLQGVLKKLNLNIARLRELL